MQYSWLHMDYWNVYSSWNCNAQQLGGIQSYCGTFLYSLESIRTSGANIVIMSTIPLRYQEAALPGSVMIGNFMCIVTGKFLNFLISLRFTVVKTKEKFSGICHHIYKYFPPWLLLFGKLSFLWSFYCFVLIWDIVGYSSISGFVWFIPSQWNQQTFLLV